MAIALLLCLAGSVATGVVAYGERGKEPLAADGATIAAEVHAEESEPCGGAVKAEGSEGKKAVVQDQRKRCTSEHAVQFAVLGVGVASYAHRKNLVAAMVNGRKHAAE
jgi:hypothetical protein